MAGGARSRDRPRRRRGQAAHAADRRPCQAGRPVRRQLPADRLRAVEPRQRGHRPDLRADPVQVALAGPAHLADLADEQHPRPVRHAGAGAAAARPALVPGQRRRDLPVAEPRLRREPDYVVVFGADHVYRMDPAQMLDAHIESGAGSRWRASACPGSRPAHSASSRPPTGTRIDGSSWRSRPTRRGCRTTPRRPSPRWATTSSPPMPCWRCCASTPATTGPSTTWAATSCRCWSSKGEAAVYDFNDNVVPGQHRA
jgi:hypothetical protein